MNGNNGINSKIVLIAIIALVVGVGIGYYAGYDYGYEEAITGGDDGGDVGGTPCTLDAKICPDGSSVGREGPNCEFAECPNTGSGGGGGILPYNSGVEGLVYIGPTCPVLRDPPDPGCDDRPYQTNLVVTSTDGSRVIAEFSSDKNGWFKVSLPPGDYSIRSAAAANILPYCSNVDAIRVSPNVYTNTSVSCDSGIR